ncbi:hypothetical protein BC831DRAFT_476396, partial [Entophlyctis helioformis]
MLPLLPLLVSLLLCLVVRLRLRLLHQCRPHRLCPCIATQRSRPTLQCQPRPCPCPWHRRPLEKRTARTARPAHARARH